MVNYFLRKVNIQEDKLENEDFQLSSFVKEIMVYDLDRIKYYLKRYLRIRIQKIERNLFYILKSNLHSHFSNDEFNYAVKYYQLIKDHFKKMFFSQANIRYGE